MKAALIGPKLKIPQQLLAHFRVFSCADGAAIPPVEELMLTAGLNILAMARFGVFRLIHGGGRDGFGLLMIGLTAIGAAIWAVARSTSNGPAKGGEAAKG